MRTHRLHKGLVLFGLIAALALRAAAGDVGALDPLARPTTRLGPAYAIALEVSVRGSNEKELCGPYVLDERGRLALEVGRKALPPIDLRGSTSAEAEAAVRAAIRAYYAEEPHVQVAIIRIPRIHVTVQGGVFRNGPLALPAGARLSDALAETSYLPNADLSRIRVVRTQREGAGIELLADFASHLQGLGDDRLTDPPLRDGDLLTVGLLPVRPAPRYVTVAGDVRRPGQYPLAEGMRVADALRAALDPLPSADPERVTISRIRGGALLIVNADRARQGVSTDNVPLEASDTLFVATRDRGLRYAILGAVPTPTTFTYRGPVTLTKAIMEAGGLRPDADRKCILLSRGMLLDPAHAQNMVIDYDRIARAERPDIALEPGDMVTVSAKKKPTAPLMQLGPLLLRLLMF